MMQNCSRSSPVIRRPAELEHVTIEAMMVRSTGVYMYAEFLYTLEPDRKTDRRSQCTGVQRKSAVKVR